MNKDFVVKGKHGLMLGALLLTLLLPHSKRELLAGLRESEQGTGAEVLVWGSVEELGETSSILLTVVLSSQ